MYEWGKYTALPTVTEATKRLGNDVKDAVESAKNGAKDLVLFSRTGDLLDAAKEKSDALLDNTEKKAEAFLNKGTEGISNLIDKKIEQAPEALAGAFWSAAWRVPTYPARKAASGAKYYGWDQGVKRAWSWWKGDAGSSSDNDMSDGGNTSNFDGGEGGANGYMFLD